MPHTETPTTSPFNERQKNTRGSKITSRTVCFCARFPKCERTKEIKPWKCGCLSFMGGFTDSSERRWQKTTVEAIWSNGIDASLFCFFCFFCSLLLQCFSLLHQIISELITVKIDGVRLHTRDIVCVCVCVFGGAVGVNQRDCVSLG